MYKYVYDYLFATIKVSCDKCADYLSNNTFNADTNRLYENASKYDQVSHLFGEPVLIHNNIYLGSAINAARFYELKNDYDIKVIINVTKEISNYFPNDFIYQNYDVLDINSDSIIDFLEDGYQFIKKHPNENILIHCFMGASRSASLVTYYLMKELNMTMDEAITFLKEKRSIVNINTTFAQELEESMIRPDN
jgi:atypical dual specificity phosphatase